MWSSARSTIPCIVDYKVNKMLVKLIVIQGYIPLLNNGVQVFEWRPSEGITGILGSNGSGKSSIMRIASPLSGERAMFDDTGSVYIEYYNDLDGINYGVGYECSGNKLVHHFYKGEELEELNRGGTGKEQDALAEQIFGYTKTIHQCLTGKIKFSLASPSKRASLLQDVVSIDVSEGEKVYDSLRSSYRDLQGAHSHLTNKIIHSQTLILEEAHVEENQELAARCLDGIEYLRQKGTPRPNSNWETLLFRFDELSKKLWKETEDVRTAKHIPSVIQDGDEETILPRLNSQIAVLNSGITSMTAEYFELEASLSDGDINHTKLKEDTEAKIKVLKKEEALEADAEFFDDIGENEYVTHEIIISNFYDFMNAELGSKDRSNLTPQICDIMNVRRLESELNGWKEQLTMYLNRIESGSAWLIRVKGTDKEECPKCKHQYWKDYDPSDVERITNSLDEYRKYPPELERKIDAAETFLLSIKDFTRSMELVMVEALKLEDSIGRVVIPYILDQKGLYQPEVFNFNVLMYNIRSVVMRVSKCVANVRVKYDLQYQYDLLRKLDSMLEGNVYEKLSRRSHELTNLLSTDTELLKVTTQAYKDAEYALSLRKFYVDAGIRIDLLMDGLLTTTEAMYAVCDFDCNDSTYRELQRRLASASELLTNNESNRAALATYEADLLETSESMEKLAILIKELSPQTGLIAQEMTNGINHFTSMMNTTLSDMWTYSMVFEPCDLEKGKLSYRFPVTVKGGKPISDIIEGSDGQRQVVDFVFTILYVEQKGLKDFPLILDEPATGLDHKHAEIFFAYVKRLASDKFCSQIFLISHMFGVMGDFAEVDLVVLDEENVSGLDGETINKNVFIS